MEPASLRPACPLGFEPLAHIEIRFSDEAAKKVYADPAASRLGWAVN